MTRFEFEAELIHWRGPAPFVFAPVPVDHSAEIRRMAKLLTYGWGAIPVEATVGDIVFRTSLFPKDGTYLLPLKDKVRHQARVTVGDSVSVVMTVRPREER